MEPIASSLVMEDILNESKTGGINDPFDQTDNPASSDHYSHLNIAVGGDHYRPLLWVCRVDHFFMFGKV